MGYGQEVRVKNTLLYDGRVGTLEPTSGEPDDWWDYNVRLSDRTIGVTVDQFETDRGLMPRETRFYECETCGKQYDSWGGAEMCEGEHDYAKEHAHGI